MKPQDVSAMRSALAAALLDADLRFTHERAGIDLIDQIMLIFRQHDGHADLQERLRVAETEKKCGWWDDDDSGWASACGVYYTFINDEGPEGNGHEFCIRCGGRVVVLDGENALCDAEPPKESI